MAINCPKCGKELSESEKVCANCGYIKTNELTEIDSSANTGFILGLVSIVAWILPLAGYPVTICGIVFSSKGLKSTVNSGKAVAGLILSILFLVVTLINSAMGVLLYLS